MIGKIFLLASVAVAASANLPLSKNSFPSCDPQGQIFLLLPHFTDCNKFFMCVHGKEVEYRCSSAVLHFNFNYQDCIWPFQGECTLRPNPEEEVIRSEEAESSEEEEIEEVISSEEAESSEQAGSDESDEGSGDGSGWDQWFKNADASELIDDDVAAALSAGIHAQSDHGVAQLNCATAHTSTRLAVYRGDCQRYWRCNNGAAESAFCSDGLYFNPKSLQCDFEANVPCARDAEILELGEEFLAM